MCVKSHYGISAVLWIPDAYLFQGDPFWIKIFHGKRIRSSNSSCKRHAFRSTKITVLAHCVSEEIWPGITYCILINFYSSLIVIIYSCKITTYLKRRKLCSINVKLGQIYFICKSLTVKLYNLQSQQRLSNSKILEFLFNYYEHPGFTSTFFFLRIRVRPMHLSPRIYVDFLINQGKFFFGMFYCSVLDLRQIQYRSAIINVEHSNGSIQILDPWLF